MKITVVFDPAGERTHTHDADWVDVDTSNGELRVEEQDLNGTVTGWTLYAAGEWRSVRLVQGPTDEVLRRRQAREERDRPTRPVYLPGNVGPR